MTQKHHTIEPVFNRQSRVLILGSFPSVKSREAGFFYHHPQNRFWKVIAALCKETVPVTILEKKALLLSHHIAIWDVVKSCELKGSDDSTIRSVTANNLKKILDVAQIEKIFINGTKAYTLYQKYCKEQTRVEAVKLPSTSAANAAWSLPRLIEEWGQINTLLP